MAVKQRSRYIELVSLLVLCACAAQPAASASPIAPASCLDANLQAKVADSDTRDQSVSIGVLVTNTSNAACALFLVPQVEMLAADGQPLEIDYHPLKEPVLPNSSWLVEAKQTVSFMMVWKNWCKAPIPGGIRISASLSAGSKPVAVRIVGTPLEQSAIYAGAVCTQPGQPADAWVSQFSNQVPPSLHP